MKKIYLQKMISMGKIALNNRFVYNSAKHTAIQNILELGSGNRSTKIIRKALHEKSSGHCLSLENNMAYYKSISEKYPEEDRGRVCFSNLIYDDKGLRYDFNLTKKYDLVYIDGPGNCDCLDKNGKLVSVKEDIRRYISFNNLWLDTRRLFSSPRMFLFDYVYNSLHLDSIILVDSSVSAMFYYYQKYRNSFNFLGFGKNISLRKRNMIIRADRIKDLVKTGYAPAKINIIYNKKSKKAPIIIKDIIRGVLN